MNILLKNIFIVSPLDDLYGRFDLHIKDGIIYDIKDANSIALQNTQELNCTDLHCFPGFFDMHVHFRDPGHLYKEDIHSGSDSAANGGFTGVLCMPNTSPPIDNIDTLKYLQDKAKGNIIDIYYSICATKERKGKEIYDYAELVRNGALALTDDGSPIFGDELLQNIFNYSAKNHIPVLQHAENYKISGNGVINEGKISREMNLDGIPKRSETEKVISDIELCRKSKDAHYHVQHISCGDTIDIIKKAKKDGICITSEVCPHHFILSEETILSQNTNAKMNPPLREKIDIDKILEGLKNNVIDVICTDHAPHSEQEKGKGIKHAPFGIIGLETCIALTYTYLVKTGIINLIDLAFKLSINPRKILKIKIPLIKKDQPANISIFDLNKEWIIDLNKFKSKSRNSPFDGWSVQGKPFGIINNKQFRLSDL